ncbi:MAG: hypothetical protein NZP72_03435 [Geminicoccaceae bacterium]|nr:hypothetical protein [Geminicoccaceae bacterium]
MVAARGSPCSRLDHPGTGEARDPAPGADRVACRLAAIAEAARLLLVGTNARDLAVVGVRLGALLAAETIGGTERVAALALVAAPASGRAHVRELEAWMRLTAGQSGDPAGRRGDGGLVLAGFALDAGTIARLRTLDPFAGSPPAGRILLCGCDRIAWCAPPARTGARVRVERSPFPGLARWLCDPLFSTVPRDFFARLVERLAQDAPTALLRSALPKTIGGASSRGPGFVEEFVLFGGERRLAGTLARPEDETEDEAGGCLLLLNTGGFPRAGPGRAAGELARVLAARGARSPRIDLAGIGDSPADAGSHRLDVFHSRALEDIAAALDLLAERGCGRSSRRVSVPEPFSPCARRSRTRASGVSFSSICLVNLPRFTWRRFDPAIFFPTRSLPTELAKAVLGRRPRRALRLLALLFERGCRSLFVSLPPGPRRALARCSRAARMLATLRARGVPILALFSPYDPGWTFFDALIGGRRGRLEGGLLEVEILEGADHVMSEPSARRRVHDLLARRLEEHGFVPRAGGRTGDRPCAERVRRLVSDPGHERVGRRRP